MPTLPQSPSSRRAPLVLHVTEALGGGIEAALRDYALSTPQYRHALLFTRRGEFSTADRLADAFVELVDAGRGVRSLLQHYRRTIDRLRPDVIHLHSAWAGLVGRAAPRDRERTALVYSPHSFYFGRRDISPVQRALALGVERALSRRADLMAVLSEFEAAEAARLGGRPVVIPNVADVPADLRWTGRDGDEIVAVGRVAAQKDPDFLLAVKAIVDPQMPHLRWTWLGAGEAPLEQRLRAGGVQVTGWLPRTEVLQRVAGATAYLHTAAWEGSPVVLLETAGLGVPTVARSIDQLSALGHDASLRTPEAVAERLVQTVLMPEIGLRPAASRDDQTAVLSAVYGQLLGDVRVPVRRTATRSARHAVGA